MEQFHDGHHVRLRSHVLGMYLHADEDGHGVSLHRRRASMNAAWMVKFLDSADLNAAGDEQQYMLLHIAAYGGYLAATDAPAPFGFGHSGLRVEQRNYDNEDVMAIIWSAILSESGGQVLLCHITRGCLRANLWNGYMTRGRISVEAINDNADITRMMHWIVEPIPDREGMPPLAPPIGFHRRPALFRLIRFVWPGVDVDAPLIDHGLFLFRGRSVFRLRSELAMRLGGIVDVANLVMCLRTGVNLLTPLLVDLPANQETFHIVVVIAGTPAHAELQYPDVDAE